MKFKNYIETESGIKDTSTSPGTAGQVLSSTVTGTSWIDQSTVASGTSRTVSILVKNISSANGGVNLSKGDPVYIYGSVGASERLYIDAADAGDSSKMPCVALLDQDLSPNGEGTATVTGKLKNLITSPIDGATPTENDTIYVKSGGGLTLTKPTGSTNLIQNVGQVGRVSTSSDGNIVVSAILRSNDVPNLPEGRIWVGDGNTIVSDVVYLDEANGHMGIGTTNPLPLGTNITTLDIQGSSGGGLRFGTTGGVEGGIYNISSGTYIGSISNVPLYLRTNNSTKATILANGNVGIGTTSPQEKVHVSGSSSVRLEVEATDSTVAALKLTNTAGSYASFVNNSGSLSTYDYNAADIRTTLLANGDFGIGTTSPNSRLEVNGEIDANGGDGYRIEGRPWANWGSDLLTLGDWDGEGYATRIMGSNSSEVMRVTGTKVGIGTTIPLNKLQVTGGSIGVDSEYIIRDNRNNTILLQSSNTVASNRSLTIGNATYSNITTASNVGIGTSAPSQKLDVTGNALISGTLYINNTSSSIYRFFNELIIQNTASTSISIGGGPGNVTNNLEVNGFVEATASTDAYKGYIKQSVICIATEKQDSTDYFFIPYNTSATSASAQYYNRMVAAYDGRVKKVYIKNTSGTPSADTVNLKKHVNNTTDATEYSATVANAASAGMSAVYNFANNDFTFSEGDNFGVLYQTVNSGGGGRSMAGVTINIIVEYNIT